jgi:hypothetical protein
VTEIKKMKIIEAQVKYRKEGSGEKVNLDGNQHRSHKWGQTPLRYDVTIWSRSMEIWGDNLEAGTERDYAL